VEEQWVEYYYDQFECHGLQLVYHHEENEAGAQVRLLVGLHRSLDSPGVRMVDLFRLIHGVDRDLHQWVEHRLVQFQRRASLLIDGMMDSMDQNRIELINYQHSYAFETGLVSLYEPMNWYCLKFPHQPPARIYQMDWIPISV
jgi:hypothetical protein